MWVIGFVALLVQLCIAWAYTNFGSVVGTELHDPFRTYFMALVMAAATPYLAIMYRTNLNEKTNSEDSE